MLPFVDLMIVICVAGCSAALSMWWVIGKVRLDGNIVDQDDQAATLLFENNALVDRFPDFPAEVYDSQQGKVALISVDRNVPDNAHIKWQNGRCWVALKAGSSPNTNYQSLVEMNALRRASDTAPYPIWQTNEGGEIIWCNTAYKTLLSMACEGADSQFLFNVKHLELPTRVEAQTTKQKPDWYEVFFSKYRSN